VLGREAHEGERLLLGGPEQHSHLGRRCLEAGDHPRQARAHLAERLGREHLANRRDHLLLASMHVALHVVEDNG
jgi:hypothetical protein